MHAQSLFFQTIEHVDLESLREFSAHLDSAPHLALYVRSSAVRRHFFTHHNILSLLPHKINAKLPSLRTLAVTRISNFDSWHPLSSLLVSLTDFSYESFWRDFPTGLEVPLSYFDLNQVNVVLRMFFLL